MNLLDRTVCHAVVCRGADGVTLSVSRVGPASCERPAEVSGVVDHRHTVQRQPSVAGGREDTLMPPPPR